MVIMLGVVALQGGETPVEGNFSQYGSGNKDQRNAI